MNAGRIETAVDSRIGWIVFDNQKRRNAMSLGMWGVTDALTPSAPIRRCARSRHARRAKQLFVSSADISEHNRNNAEARRPTPRPPTAWRVETFENR